MGIKIGDKVFFLLQLNGGRGYEDCWEVADAVVVDKKDDCFKVCELDDENFEIIETNDIFVNKNEALAERNKRNKERK